MIEHIATVANMRIRASAVDVVAKISIGTRIYLRSGEALTVDLPLEDVVEAIWPGLESSS